MTLCNIGLSQTHSMTVATLIGVIQFAFSSPSIAAIDPPIRVIVPVTRVPSPANTWCTYDVATGSVGAVTVVFSAGYNKMRINACVTDTEVGAVIISKGTTKTFFTDYYGGQTLGLSADIYVTQIFLSASRFKAGEELNIFEGHVGSYYRLCDEDRGSHPAEVSYHQGTASTTGTGFDIVQAADKGYFIFEEHGNAQC